MSPGSILHMSKVESGNAEMTFYNKHIFLNFSVKYSRHDYVFLNKKKILDLKNIQILKTFVMFLASGLLVLVDGLRAFC